MLDIEKIFPLVLVGEFATFALVEALRPARPLPRVRGWKLKGVLGFLLTGATSSAVPLLYMDWIRAHRLQNLEWLGTLGGAALAFVVLELVLYWVHRAAHRTLLWRAFHQVHHSAERVDSFGAAYFHPLEVMVGGFVGAVVGTMLLGVSGQAAALATLVAISISFFQHTNVKTPRWLGYFVARPEGHSIHHERGVHAKNYSRIPLIDMLFGTFENPEYFSAEAGFYPGSSGRFLEMLVGIDGSVPERDRAERRPVVTAGE